jgi:hypothetical protein
MAFYSSTDVVPPDGRYVCQCVEGTCTPEDDDSEDTKVATGGRRFNGHWERDEAGNLHFVIDRTWIEDP